MSSSSFSNGSRDVRGNVPCKRSHARIDSSTTPCAFTWVRSFISSGSVIVSRLLPRQVAA
jgi:hypothetical protein